RRDCLEILGIRKKDIVRAMSFIRDQIYCQPRLGMNAGAVLGTLLIKIVEVIVARPQNKIIKWVERLHSIKHFVLNNRIIQLLIFMAVPFADTQPVLTVTEGVHPLVQNTSIEQVVDGQVHVTEVCATPEAQTIITVKA